MLRDCRHPNIIRMIDYFSEGKTEAIVLESGEIHLKDYMDKGHDIREKQRIIRQIIRANYVNSSLK